MTINTVNTKRQQLTDGYFQIGTGVETILLMGSCRTVPYVQYLHDWNEANNNRFTICFIDPFNWHFDTLDNRVDYRIALMGLEKDKRLLDMLKSVKIFIHEYYQNAGMFNVNKEAGKTIYDFGMKPEIDVCIPNWNDLFVLFGDIVTFDSVMRTKAIQDYNVLGKLSEQTKKEIFEIGQDNVRKFGKICYQSSLPEMANIFLQNWLDKRMFWTYNHVSKHFTLEIFELMNNKFLHLDLEKGFDRDHVDMFANNYTKLTEYDIEFHKFKWGEEIGLLKSKIFG